FSVSLPVSGISRSEAPPARGRASRSEAPAEARAGLAGLRILVVDDQSDARELIGTVLRQYGAEVSVAESAAAAFRALELEPFDVLVSDVGMPIEDGYALIKRLRAQPRPALARLPAVALTAYARSEDQKRALDSGYDVHVAKPIEPGRLVAAVMQLAHRQ
ncbi:MAG TPA: response regulator, partial [Polyangiaceae bacterium]